MINKYKIVLLIYKIDPNGIGIVCANGYTLHNGLFCKTGGDSSNMEVTCFDGYYKKDNTCHRNNFKLFKIIFKVCN